MKKHILGEHLVAWRKWKSANVAFDLKELHWEKSKQRFVIGYGAITDHFGNGNPYKKDDAQQQKIMEDLLLFVAKAYMPISVEKNQWLRHLVMR
jgi:hypothetical protein